MLKIKILCCLFILFSLNACATAVVSGGTSVALAKYQERSIDNAIDDTIIKVNLNTKWFNESLELYSDCNMTISEGRVLLTGVVKDELIMETAVKLTWQVKGVQEVINEIEVELEGKPLLQYSKDTWIATKLRTKILAASDILSINYSIDVNNSKVYLIGIAQDQKELDRVIEIVRTTSSVESVTTYVRVKESKNNTEYQYQYNSDEEIVF